MDIVEMVVQILAGVAGTVAALVSVLILVKFRWPAALWFVLKLFASALSPWFALTGVVTTAVGLLTGSFLLVAIGVYTLAFFAVHIFRVTRPPDHSTDFEQAFGPRWDKHISSAQGMLFLRRRSVLKLPPVAEARVEHNIPFSAIPGSGRQLLCDVWQPAEGVAHSGLGLIYLHGSAYYIFDKDFGTRPFFSHLASQGHVIMDVAHRLAPETDIMGMVNDVKRATVWMKDQAARYGVHPDRIVVAGGSSGGHLALLSAYTWDEVSFAPEELAGRDTSVCAVISLYGPADLEALYYHTNQHLTTRTVPGIPKIEVPTQIPAWVVRKMGSEYHRLSLDKDFEKVGAMAPLLGGHPDACHETYTRFSPVTHVHRHCPPTLLIHGDHDIMAPVMATRHLYARLAEENVKAVMHIIPQTDHAFDLIMPRISPSAHNAWYDVERFLAMQVKVPVARDAMVDV